jgi:RNA polymerase sigma-70 factor (ECF subfamily)
MLEGLSHRQAGEMLGINSKAVETRVYRAKRQLAVMLSPDDLSDIAAASF